MNDTLGVMKKSIKSAGDLHSVVKAMKATSAANIGQYQKSLLALGDYYHTVELGLALCLKESKLAPLTSFTTKKSTSQNGGRTDMVVFGSDQGLVGPFNDNIADDAIKTFATLQVPKEIWAVGERVQECLESSGLSIKGSFPVPTSIEAIVPLVDQILMQTDASVLFLVSNRPVSHQACSPMTRRVLPLDGEWIKQTRAVPWPNKNLAEVLGDPTETLRALIHEYLFVSIFRACAESLASENATRLAAMQRADRSIDTLVRQLTTQFHRMRQNQIDEELFDVIAGFDALGGEST